MIRLVILLAVIAGVLFLAKIVMDRRNVDRPQRIGRKEARALQADYVTLVTLVNELDTQARVEVDLNPTTAHFANNVARQISQSRRQLTP